MPDNPTGNYFRARGEDRRDISSPYAGTGWDDGNWHHYVVTFTRGVGGSARVLRGLLSPSICDA